MVRSKEDPCCWRCQSCGFYRYKVDELRCEKSARRHDSDEERVWLRTYPEQFVDYSNPWAIVAMTVAVSGNLRSSASTPPRRRSDPRTNDDGIAFVRRYGTDRVRLLGVLDLSAHTDDQSVRSRAVVSTAGRCVRLLLDDVRVVSKPAWKVAPWSDSASDSATPFATPRSSTKINRIHRIFNDPGRSPRKRR